ncbi:hypothetical protein [Moorena sp. SIO3H5]|uniref:hypothetical protein n=1 Tax=Moorena sp. SIO3H5 TaxID=2607834 RepID=UPI0013BE365B|nr:hypothetical protein [Moorena sp. SIO3H5]NEO74669.1 hypothetical protein [Moorena sp. SIO3H5]
MGREKVISNLESMRSVLTDAHNKQLIEPTFEESLAIKKTVNVANSVLENAKQVDEICARDTMILTKMSETTSRNYLIVLNELGYLEKRREGKGYVYTFKYLQEEF